MHTFVHHVLFPGKISQNISAQGNDSLNMKFPNALLRMTRFQGPQNQSKMHEPSLNI